MEVTVALKQGMWLSHLATIVIHRERLKHCTYAAYELEGQK